MAVLEKIRVKFGLGASIIIAIGLLSFIIGPNDLMNSFNAMSSKNDVGKINGKSISYPDFQKEVEKYKALNEMMTGSSVMNDQQQKQIRDVAWQALVNKFLFIPEAKDAGIHVGDAELVAMTAGDMISPMIANNPLFQGEDGAFSIERFQQFVSNVDMDQSGRMRLYWDNLQNSLYTGQFYAKYNSLFANSMYVNPLMMKNAIADNNTTSDVDFLMVPYDYSFNDSTITVSNREIKKYYKDHKKFFKQQASRDIEYVVYEVVPSDEDIIASNDDMNKVYDEFATTERMKNFLLKNSDKPYVEFYYKAGDLNPISKDLNNFVFEKNDVVTPVVREGDNFLAARVMDTKQLPDSVYVSHILLAQDNANIADSLLTVLKKGGNFANLVSLYSADQNSAADGELGNIGWMTQTYMIPGFESVLTASVNKPFIIETQYGKHIVNVSKRTKPILKKKVAILEKETLASKKTFNSFYAKANTFASMANGSYANYKAAADSLGAYSHTMNNVLESNENYGAIEKAKEVTRWIFEAKKGKVSNIITVNNNYFFVAVLKNIHKEGYTPVEEVSDQIKMVLTAEKYHDKMEAEIASKISGVNSLEAMAEKLGVKVSKKEGIAFSSMNSAGLDPAFIGAVAGAKEGKISGPIAGRLGVYVFKVTGRETGSFYSEDDAKNAQLRLAQYSAQIVPMIMGEDKITDNRARFY